jgi:hypothetical protein
MQIYLTFQVNYFQVTFNLIFMNWFQVNHFMNYINASWIVLMQISSEPNANFFDISNEPNIYELFSSEPHNLQNSNNILLCGGGRESRGPRRWWRQARRRSERMVWTQRRSVRCWGGRGGGAGAWRGPGDGRGGSRCDVEVPTEEERVRAWTRRWLVRRLARRRHWPNDDGAMEADTEEEQACRLRGKW